MNRNLSVLFAVLLCLSLIFSGVAADSPWSHYTGPLYQAPTDETELDAPVMVEPETTIPAEEPELTEPEITPNFGGALAVSTETGTDIESADLPETFPGWGNLTDVIIDELETVRKEGSITVNSIQIASDDESVQQIQNLLNGLRVDYKTQSGDPAMKSFTLSLGEEALFSYSLQEGTPYYVNTNFLGTDTYMIYDEDQFEESVAMALYDLVEMMSEDEETSLPSRDEILFAIQTIREAKNGSADVTVTSSFSMPELSEEVDFSAFMMPLMDIMMRLDEAEPTAGIYYTFTDFQNADLKFDWPDAAALPEIPQAVSAISGTITGADIQNILNAIPVFFNDNPELKSALNQGLTAYFVQQGVSEEELGGEDIVGGIVDDMLESMEGSFDGLSIPFKMDMDENGFPVMITIEIDVEDETQASGMIMTIIVTSDEDITAVDVALDLFADTDVLPAERVVLVTDSENNMMMDIAVRNMGSDLDVAYITVVPLSTEEIELRSTNISFAGETVTGSLSIDSMGVVNAFDGMDKSVNIVYTQAKDNETQFALDLTVNSITTEPEISLTPENAVAAATLTSADYENLAQGIFMQLMMLMMAFM